MRAIRSAGLYVGLILPMSSVMANSATIHMNRKHEASPSVGDIMGDISGIISPLTITTIHDLLGRRLHIRCLRVLSTYTVSSTSSNMSAG